MANTMSGQRAGFFPVAGRQVDPASTRSELPVVAISFCQSWAERSADERRGTERDFTPSSRTSLGASTTSSGMSKSRPSHSAGTSRFWPTAFPFFRSWSMAMGRRGAGGRARGWGRDSAGERAFNLTRLHWLARFLLPPKLPPKCKLPKKKALGLSSKCLNFLEPARRLELLTC